MQIEEDLAQKELAVLEKEEEEEEKNRLLSLEEGEDNKENMLDE